MTTALKIAAKYKEKKKVPAKDGGKTTVYVYSERQVQNRNKDKAKRIESLRGNISKLMAKVKKDLKSDDLDTRLIALAVALIDHTYERVGNETSADERGHYGVTGWLKSHIRFSKGKATISYTGKSGVDHVKKVTDSAILSALRDACEAVEKDDPIFEYDGGKVTPDKVNEYLRPYKVTAKDLRGYHANASMKEKLKEIRGKGGKLPEDKKEKKKKLQEEWKEALEATAEVVGHEASTLQSQYLVPGLKKDFEDNGRVDSSFLQKASSSLAARVAARYAERYDGETLDSLHP